jgi:hypothetical protein
MAAAYQSFASGRTTEPDPASLLTQLRAAVDATVGVQHAVGAVGYLLKKGTAWTAAQITAAQTVLDTAPAATDQLTAQSLVDALSLLDKAQDLALLDEINVLRTALSLAPRTVVQALTAIRAKAGQLS